MRRSRADEKPFRALLDERQRSRISFCRRYRAYQSRSGRPLRSAPHRLFFALLASERSDVWRQQRRRRLASRCRTCKRMFPDLRRRMHTAAHVWQARYAQPLVVRNYGQTCSAAPKRRSRASSSPAWRKSIRRIAAPTTPFVTAGPLGGLPTHLCRATLLSGKLDW